MTAEQAKKPVASFGLDLAQIKPSAPRSVPEELADRVGREMGFVSREATAETPAAPAAPATGAGYAPGSGKIPLRTRGEAIDQLNMRLYLKDINSFIEHARDTRLSYKDLFADVWRHYQKTALDKAEG